MVGVLFGKRADFDGMSRKESGLNEFVLAIGFEKQIQNVALFMAFLEFDMMLFCNRSCFFERFYFSEINFSNFPQQR